MMVRALPYTLLISVFAFLGCNDKAVPPVVVPLNPDRVTAESALDEVDRFVALGSRVPGSPGAERAANYLLKRLTDLGLDTRVDMFEEETPTGSTTFRNVIATSSGPAKRTVVLVSHYDTKGGISEDFVGANDSGSSTGLLLAMAPMLKNGISDALRIILLFVDGEECQHRYAENDGLHGSRYAAQQFKQRDDADDIVAVIVVDMVGDRDLNVSIPRNGSSSLISLTFDSAEAEGVRQTFSLFRSAITDDHVPFLDAGFPAIDLIDFHYGSKPGKNDYWHTNKDTMDKLSGESLETVGRVVVRMLNALAVDPQ
ncbi:MAG: M28 family peptidase [Kiritimatiellae bacterium]|nr:M28 family peptidase [Kiritimatiellia bacterium]